MQMNNELSFTPDDLEVEKLLLDPENPRLPEDMRGADQLELIEFIAEEYDSLTIARSISLYGYFPSDEGVLFLNPIANIALLDIQQKVFDLFKGFPDDNSPKTWVPHSTLAIDIPLNSIVKAIEIVKDVIVMKMGAPFEVEAKSLVLVEFQTDPVSVLSTEEIRFKDLT